MKKEKRIYSNSYLLSIRTIVFIIWDPRKIKNSHVKLHNVATWLKWSEFFTCWEIRPMYDYMFLRNQSWFISHFCVFQLPEKAITISLLSQSPWLWNSWDCFFVLILQAFFQRWWNEQSEEIQSIVRKLISSGQLELM